LRNCLSDSSLVSLSVIQELDAKGWHDCARALEVWWEDMSEKAALGVSEALLRQEQVEFMADEDKVNLLKTVDDKAV